jgi:lysozyme
MRGIMQLSDKGLDLIIGFEGKLKKLPDGKYQAYQCQAGVWTIYVGCTVGVTDGMVIDEAQGRAMFRAELAKHEVATAKALKVDVTQDQYDALVSFSYNCGTGAMQRVAAVLNAEGPKAAAAKLMEYCKFTNPTTKQLEVSRGLLRRRAAEAKLMEPDDTPLGTMPQKVEAPPAKMTVKEAVTKVGAAAGAAGAAATQAKEIIPPVPQAAKDALANAKELQSVGGEIATIGKSAYSAAAAYPILAALICAGVAAYWWLTRAKPQ